jgi:hypothetical protein
MNVGLIPLVAMLATGCAAPARPTLPGTAPGLPDSGIIIQRGVLTVRGRQFSLNGYLARSATRAQRLIVTETFGGVLADVLVTPDGAIHVMRSSPAFKPSWIHRHLVADLRCIFGSAPHADSKTGKGIFCESPTHDANSACHRPQDRWKENRNRAACEAIPSRWIHSER